MADRIPIYSSKGHRSQIGYIENEGAFDLSGRRRCNYNAATGNLSDSITEKIVGYVSYDGNFVVPSRIAAELFEQPVDSQATSSIAKSEPASAEGSATKVSGSSDAADAFLEHAMAMVRSSFKNEPP
jgi:hypothetical protein